MFNRLIHAPRTSHPFPFPALLIQFPPCFPLFNFTAGLSIFKLKQQGKGTLGAIEKALQSDSDMTRMVSSVWRGEFLIPARGVFYMSIFGGSGCQMLIQGAALNKINYILPNSNLGPPPLAGIIFRIFLLLHSSSFFSSAIFFGNFLPQSSSWRSPDRQQHSPPLAFAGFFASFLTG